MDVINDCTFCEEFARGEHSNFRKLFPPRELENRILVQSEHFAALPGLGTLGQAYLLILPKEHFSAMAQVPDEWFPELTDFTERVRKLVTELYTSPILFEHGPAVSGKIGSGCCIDHAHIHLVATTVDLLDEIHAIYSRGTLGFSPDARPRVVTDVRAARDWLDQQIPYLWYQNHEQVEWLFPILKPVESQFLRKVLARKLNMADPEWDWALFPRKQRVIKNYREIMSALKLRERVEGS